MSIKVEQLTKFYGTQKALNNVSFEVKKPEVVGFLGPNGAGKSTMMKILTTYIYASEGAAKVNDFDITTQTKQVQQSVGYLPEHNPLYLDMYVKEYLSFNAQIYNVTKSRVNEVIELTGLTPEAHKTIGQLSKGYRQRVGLANALLHDPDVLILDEPTSALDAETEHGLFERYASAAKKDRNDGRITILVSHRFSTVRMADLIVVLDGSRLVEFGSHEDLVAAGGTYADLYDIQAASYR